MIDRHLQAKVQELLTYFPVVTITGPRQSGKTTLVKSLSIGLPYITLEDIDIRLIAEEDPRGFLNNYPGGAILDEVQRVPQLFSYIQGIVDSTSATFILSGSQNFQLIEQIGQSLAGRVGILKLLPLSLEELKPYITLDRFHQLIFQGFYPRVYDKSIPPTDFYPPYITTYIERDVRLIKNIDNLGLFSKFIKLCAGRIGQPLNMNTLANDTGISPNTVRSWLSILEASYIIHFLQPYHTNFNKRIIKSPKLYFYDTGVACSLLGIESTQQLTTHYLIGNLFENFILNELIKYQFNQGKKHPYHFWQDKTKREVDIVVDKAGVLLPIEMKSGATLHTSYFDNLRYWQKVAKVDMLSSVVVYGGDKDLIVKDGQFISWRSLESLFELM
jgi:predicted AAA+ superfamily ATPase